jgi:serine/threonine-protein phosphatase PGAM5
MVATVAAQAPAGFTRTLYLIRHGNADYSVKGDETVVNGLTPLGIAQARLTAARLRGLPVKCTSLVASPLTRARETGQIIQQELQLPLQISPLLRECTPRTWRTEVTKGETPASLDAAEAQLNEAFARYCVPARDADQQDVLVCHGNVIRYFVTKALGVDTQAWLGMSLVNGSLTIIQVKADGSYKVLAVGDAGHIPPNLQSGLTAAEPQLVVTPAAASR